ncbi:hypothetical protein SAMN05519104_4456 [Rhizobiales bacterium GAS188]|nr:hypothetical protein SAMN05519104_4456 [Rhizobiales bacterium GAS188]
MLLIADHIEPAVEQAMNFVCGMMNGSTSAFYLVSPDSEPYDFVLRNVQMEFHRHYVESSA